MKRTIKIILAAAIFFNLQLSNCIINCASAQNASNNSILHRTNVSLSLNSLTSLNFDFGGGLLNGHPERSVDLTASIRLWQHVEVGGVLSLQGASNTGFSGVYHFNSAPNVNYFYLGWDDNRYHIGGGAMVQIHLISFDKRYIRDNNLDLVVRGGWGTGGQVDGFWFGIGEELRISRQLIWSVSCDYGEFPFAYLKQVADDESGWRFTTALKISLK